MVKITAAMTPLRSSHFQLDSSGVAGFFGGEEAVTAMGTVHVYAGRKWLGWYNSPGSYTVAKKYGQLANSRFWRGFFPGVTVDPAVLFEFQGTGGPEFKALHSGTKLRNTGRTGFLFMRQCEEMPAIRVDGRKTHPMSVTIAEMKKIHLTDHRPTMLRGDGSWLAVFPITASLAGCALCGMYRDWYVFAMILLGIFTSGLSCYVIGGGTLTFSHPQPAKGCPPGDGILKADSGLVVLRGEEGAVNAVTRGRFSLWFASAPEHRAIGVCSMLLIVQFLAQLLLIPQGSLFGQIMFLSTLAVSWAYNSFLSSLDGESIQRHLLMNSVLENPRMRKYELQSWTAAVAFVLLASKPSKPRKLLNDLLDNDTHIWNKWKEVVMKMAEAEKFDERVLSDPMFLEGVNDQEERELLTNLYKDAKGAFDGWVLAKEQWDNDWEIERDMEDEKQGGVVISPV